MTEYVVNVLIPNALSILIVTLLTLAFLLALKPTRESILSEPIGKVRRNDRDGKTRYPVPQSVAPFDRQADYWNVQKWTEDAIQKGIDHDFGTLNRPSVVLHYNHADNADCTDECKIVENPNREGIEK